MQSERGRGDGLRRPRVDGAALGPVMNAFTVFDIHAALWLAAAPFLGLAAYQITRPLDHPTRRRIYEHLLRLPGNHFRSIVRSLHMSIGTARHHLDVLVRHGLVREEKVRNRSRYYPYGRDAEPQVNRLYQQHWGYRDLRLRVLFAVQRMDSGAGPSTVGRALGISRQLAAYHLARLEEAGRIRREGGQYRARALRRGP